jgi:RES domain-containing protein
MITSWRITKKKYANQALTGEGAKLWGGRWNPPGTPAIYTSDSLALAILELIVHLEAYDDIANYVAIPVQFGDAQVAVWPTETLPKKWAALPISSHTQKLGKNWLDTKQSLVLKVPSAVVHLEHNFVINPLHPEFPAIQIGRPVDLLIDSRIVEKLL